MTPNIKHIVRKLTIVANLILFILSFLLIRFGYNSIDPFYSTFNPLIVTLLLSGYILIKSIAYKNYTTMFWIDIIFCYIIYGIVYHLGICLYNHWHWYVMIFISFIQYVVSRQHPDRMAGDYQVISSFVPAGTSTVMTFGRIDILTLTHTGLQLTKVSDSVVAKLLSR